MESANSENSQKRQNSPKTEIYAHLAGRELQNDYTRYFERGDKGLADFFVDHYGTLFKVTDVLGNGYYWADNAKLWERMYAAELELLVNDALEEEIRAAMIYSLKMKKEKLEKILERKVLHDKSSGGVFRMVKKKLFALEKGQRFEQQINVSNPEVLPVRGGKLVSLRTGVLRDRVETDLFSFELDVTFLGMDCSKYTRAHRFFHELCAGREDLKRYFLQVFGYCLTGETREKAFFSLVGKGHNGKTTMMKVMEAILGPYYTPCSKYVFLRNSKKYQDANSATPALLAFKGRRLVSCSEMSEDERLNEAQVKELTGGGTISARGLHEGLQSFPNHAKVMMETNEVPSFNAHDEALEFRMKLLPFLTYFARSGREIPQGRDCVFTEDQAFIDDIMTRDCLDEIFTLLIGCGTVPWYAGGCVLVEPEICKTQFSKLVNEREHFHDFLEHHCLKAASLRVKRVEFYKAYLTWCTLEGFHVLSKSKIFEKMTALKYTESKYNGSWYFVGLDLRAPIASSK